MSDASVITDVSETLRSILDAHLNPSGPPEPGAPPGVGAPVTVTVDNPQRSAGEDLRVNLYLYHILQDESRRNTGPRLQTSRSADSATFIAEPLPLKLYYMVTAFAPEGRTEHRLIGETLQAFYTHRILEPAVLKGGLATSPIKPDRIQLVLLNQDLETLHRIWGNFQEALRPSATYEVDGVYLDARPALEHSVKIVQQRAIDVVAIPFLADVSPGAARPGATVRLYGANLDLRSPDGATSLVRILFNGAPIAPVADRRTNRALSIVIPPSTPPGEATLQAQIDDFTSRSVVLQVLP
jgi:Pvc16 N-terminal domain